MAWGDEIPQTIIETVAGEGAYGNGITANPGEKIHFDIERIDAAPTDAWLVCIEVTTDPTVMPERWSSPPILCRRLRPTQLIPNFVVSGFYAYRIYVANDDITPFDKVQVTIRYRKDGVNL